MELVAVPASGRAKARPCGVRGSKQSTGLFCPPSAVAAHPMQTDQGR